jgi:uncharacterized protein YndB with AHSA1/START domain
VTEPTLELTRRFAAPPEHVFAAWTDPALLRRWWAALAGWETAAADVDLRPGGRYRLTMRDPVANEEYTVAGTYLDVRRPDRLAYTWTWEGEADIMRGSADTVVEVEFVADGAETEVRLTHRGFADERIRDLHGEGWGGCLENLERRVLAREPAP